MPFDPSLPADNSLASAGEMRNQLNSLKAILDTCPDDAGVEAITAGQCLGVNYLGLTVSDPPTQAEVQSIADKLDEILTSLRRE